MHCWPLILLYHLGIHFNLSVYNGLFEGFQFEKKFTLTKQFGCHSLLHWVTNCCSEKLIDLLFSYLLIFSFWMALCSSKPQSENPSVYHWSVFDSYWNYLVLFKIVLGPALFHLNIHKIRNICSQTVAKKTRHDISLEFRPSLNFKYIFLKKRLFRFVTIVH